MGVGMGGLLVREGVGVGEEEEGMGVDLAANMEQQASTAAPPPPPLYT
jgi:hypothetical protein